MFWLSSYHELNDRTGDLHAKYPGHFVVISQIVHLALMVDFFYFYIKRYDAERATLGLVTGVAWWQLYPDLLVLAVLLLV